MKTLLLYILAAGMFCFFCTEQEANGGGGEPPPQPTDTIPPIVNITYPHSGDEFMYCTTINVSADVTDNEGVSHVTFRVTRVYDNAVIIDWEDYAEPYIYMGWHPECGYPEQRYYKILVTGFDLEGNSSQDYIVMSVIWID